MVDVQAMLQPLLAGGFYHYLGSLTTPPCTPGVSWYVLKQQATVCQRQIDRLTAARHACAKGPPGSAAVRHSRLPRLPGLARSGLRVALHSL